MLKVSFYSYKGGAGRSTTSWNTVQRLVKELKPTAKEPFVIVDTDTESAGSTFLYKAQNSFYNNKEYASIQKRMTDGDATNYSKAADAEKEKFFNGMYPAGTHFGLPDTEKKAVLLIGANLHKTSANKADVSGEGGDGSEQIKNFRKLITTCKDCGAKALFFDTPSGTQFLAGRSVFESEIIICCMRPTSQFREGTKKQLIDFIKNDFEKNSQKKYILTPTVVCIDAGQIFLLDGEERVYPGAAKKAIVDEFSADNIEENDEIKEAYKKNVIFDMLEPTPDNAKIFADSEDNDSVFGIPEIKRFKWFETCLGKMMDEGGELTPNDKMAVNRYEYLAKTILTYRKN